MALVVTTESKITQKGGGGGGGADRQTEGANFNAQSTMTVISDSQRLRQTQRAQWNHLRAAVTRSEHHTVHQENKRDAVKWCAKEKQMLRFKQKLAWHSIPRATDWQAAASAAPGMTYMCMYINSLPPPPPPRLYTRRQQVQAPHCNPAPGRPAQDLLGHGRNMRHCCVAGDTEKRAIRRYTDRGVTQHPGPLTTRSVVRGSKIVGQWWLW